MCLCAFRLKALPEMTYTVSGGTLNPTHSLTHLSSVFQFRIFIPSLYVLPLKVCLDLYSNFRDEHRKAHHSYGVRYPVQGHWSAKVIDSGGNQKGVLDFSS